MKEIGLTRQTLLAIVETFSKIREFAKIIVKLPDECVVIYKMI
jgi:hypothetical protein